MPVMIKNDLPIKQVLEKENIFLIDERRAERQDIRPVDILVMNLLHFRSLTEVEVLRSLSNTLLQVNVTFLVPEKDEKTKPEKSCLDTPYMTFSEVRKKCFDGLIVTGAYNEDPEYEDISYWEELKTLFDWADSHVTSMFFLGWSAGAALYHYYGINKRVLPQSLFGVYPQKLMEKGLPLIRGFDDEFMVPHLRYTGVDDEALAEKKNVAVLAASEDAGTYLCMNRDGSKVFCLGHPEFDRLALDNEYKRVLEEGGNMQMPCNYYSDDDTLSTPPLQWLSHANALFSNWMNYYVYQNTP